MRSVSVSGAIALAAFFFGSAQWSTAQAPANDSVTFAKDVAPILQERCKECHHKGAMAPMSLLTYQDARPWARAIKQQVVQRNMPPWYIDRAVGIHSFKNDPSLSEKEIEALRYSAHHYVELKDDYLT